MTSERTRRSVATLYPDWPQHASRTATRVIKKITQVHPRASVLNRMFTHHAFHAGEISQLLGVNHLPPIDLWARPSA